MKTLLCSLVAALAGAALVATISAAGSNSFALWKAHDLRSFTKSEMLGDYGNHNTRMTFRDKDGEVEIHQNWTDIMVIESGAATLVIGGTAVDPKTTAPGELRAEKVEGGGEEAGGSGRHPAHPGGHAASVPGGSGEDGAVLRAEGPGEVGFRGSGGLL